MSNKPLSLLVLSTVLIACGGDPEPDPDATATAGTSSGTTMPSTSSTTTAAETGSSTSSTTTGSSSSETTDDPGTTTSDSGTSSGSGSSESGGSTLTGFEILSYATDIEPIILENCGAGGICHQATEAPASGMLLAEGSGYDSLVGVASAQVPELQRVNPGAPGMSYILNKLEGTGSSVGGAPSRMPLGGDPLSDEDFQMIRIWIAGGAMP